MNEKYIDLLKKSQRITGHPSMSMKESMKVFTTLNDNQMPDVYGMGTVITQFQNRISEIMNKEASIFFPSGTMAQQIALRICCDYKNLLKVAYHPLSHLEIHEQDGLKKLHNIETVLIGEKDRLFTLEDLKTLPEISVVLFELPQRELGGLLPSWDDLVEMITYCKSRGFYTHLDGARLFECLPYYKKTASEVAELFDFVYISFYKGFGSITGAMLSSTTENMEISKVWKRRYGGDLYHLFPYIVPAQESFELRKDKMSIYYENAKIYAKLLKEVKGVTLLPETPVCNMFHIFIEEDKEVLTKQLMNVMTTTGLAIIGGFQSNEKGYKSEISIGDSFDIIGIEKIKNAVRLFKKLRK